MTLKSLYQIFAQHPESQWVMKQDSARVVFDFVRANPVRNVLDLGTGIGAAVAVVALALKDRKEKDSGEPWKHVIHTVDQFDKCHKLAQELIPEELKKNIVFHRTDAQLWTHPDIPDNHLSTFKELPEPPEGGWHLIITDGPGPWKDGSGRFIDVPNGDVLKLHSEGKIGPGTVVYFDGRLQALGLIERFHSKDFLLVSHGNRLNFLERKETERIFEDGRLKQFESWGYFKP